MSDGPLVSIGLPVYNGERFLAQAIESMLAQDVGDLELIISDNGSTDATERICRDFARADPRVRYHRSDRNRGAAWNYNRTFGLARGTYFKWAAHDDLCAPTFISTCLQALERQAEASLCYANTIRIDGDGREYRREPPTDVASQSRPSDRVRSLLLRPTPCFEVFGVMRRAQLARTGLIGNYTSSDRVLLLELALQGRFVLIEEHLFFSRQHPQRSVQRYKDSRERNAWFDPSLRHTRTAPAWRLLREYAAATGGSRLPAAERIRSLAVLGQWAADHGSRLLREACRYGWHLVAARPERRAVSGGEPNPRPHDITRIP
jgi:glycosyltransferase involved in cell wall biosynthesis